MNFQGVDRLPRWEWAMWWDETIARWKQEGLPAELDGVFEIAEYFGLDPYQQFWFSTTDTTIEAVQHHVEGIVSNMDDYLRLRGRFFPDHAAAIEAMRPWAGRQARGEAVVWITLEGFFWFPRTLMGFTKISLAFYDQPELLHRINQDLADFNLKILEGVAQDLPPDLRHDRRGHVLQQRADDLPAAFRRVRRALLPADRAPLARAGGNHPGRYRRRRHAAGALVAARGDPGRLAAGTAGGR